MNEFKIIYKKIKQKSYLYSKICNISMIKQKTQREKNFN